MNQVLVLQPKSGVPAMPGKAGQKAFRLHKNRIVIGSVVSADVRLVGEGVEPIHAVIELVEGVPTIYDLASSTGIFVNGERTVTKGIKQGDEIRIGSQTLQFSLEDVNQAALRERVRESEGRKLFMSPQEDFAPLLLEDEREVVEIFDFTSTSRQALEVVMSWCGTILDVEHFVSEKAVTLGNTQWSDFGIPPLLSSKNYPLITRKGEDFTLNLDAGMKGVIQRNGSIHTLDQIRAGVVQSPDGYHIPLGRKDFAKITVGEIDFYLCFTSAPPRLRRRKLMERDPYFYKILFTSLAMTAAILTAVMNITVPKNLDVEQVPERIATILYQPEKYVPKPKPPVDRTEPKPVETQKTEAPKPKETPEPKKTVKVDIKPNPAVAKQPIPKEMNMTQPPKPAPKAVAAGGGRSQGQNKAKEGEGARAKGKEGQRGAPNAPKTDQPQTSARRPSPEGGKGKGSGNSQVVDEGNVDFLKGASDKIQNLLGNSAANLGRGGEKLQGFGGFTSQGKGGLALSGDGQGGGGNAASLGGLGEKGRGGGRVGTGMGAAGDGSGIVGGKARVLIRSGGPEESVVMGAIDSSAIEAAILAHRDEFRLCYEKEINAENPNLSGRVGVNFVIGSSGRVNQAGIESTTLKNANTERCIVTVMKRIEFPIPKGAGIVQVSYPFKFNPINNR